MKITVIILIVLSGMVSTTQANILAEYDADAGTPIESPTVQGWTETGLGSGVTVEGVNDGGTNAWRIYDNAGSLNPNYSASLSAGDLQDMYDSGWEFTFVVRSVQGSTICGFCGWGVTTSTDPGWGLTDRERVGFSIELTAGNAFQVTPIHGGTITLGTNSADEYHAIRCVGMPQSSQYEFYLDDALQGTYDIKDGGSNDNYDNLIKFASGSTAGTGRDAYWNYVNLKLANNVIAIAQSGGSTEVAEEGETTDSYDISLLQQPLHDVTVTITPDGGPAEATNVDLGNGPGVGITRSFTTQNWGTSQQVTVKAVEDLFEEGTHQVAIRNAFASSDPNFDGLLRSVTVTITDNDSSQREINFSSEVFVSPKGGYVTVQELYHTFRIPGMVVAADGSVLAFSEGRRGDGSDPRRDGNAPMDMVMRRSTDNGQTWADLVVIDSGFQPDGVKVDFGDPTPVLDATTGEIILFYGQWPDLGTVTADVGQDPDSANNNQVVWVRSSADNGLTWSERTQILYPDQPGDTPDGLYWHQAEPGPGSGIQLQYQDGNPLRNGRLLIPAKRTGSTDGAGTSSTAEPFIYYSDDHGATWQFGSTTTGPDANEDEVVELTNSDVLLDARQNSGSYRRRHLSTDGGVIWGADMGDDVVITAVDCSMFRYSARRDGDDLDRILFSGPLGSGRYNAAVWTSYDEGKSFINPVQVNSEFAAYSVVTRLADDSIGLLIETENDSGQTYGDITLYNFDIEYLEGMTHQPGLTHYDGFGNVIDRQRGGVGWSGSWSTGATFTDASAPEFNGPSIDFEGLKFQKELGRVDLVTGESTQRNLATGIDLNNNGVTYISLLISAVLDTSADDGADEFLNIELRDSSDVTHIAFGVGSDEEFYIGQLGNTVTTANDALVRSGKYYVVLKLVTQNDGLPVNFDQVFLKVFESGVDEIPSVEDGMAWTLAGTSNENSNALIDRILVDGGNLATWSLDELRIGLSYESVVGNPPYCGQSGTVYYTADFNRDCYIDLVDLSIFASYWLTCTHPADPINCDF